MKLICPNVNCINKSIVYRQFNVARDHVCKACDSVLVLVKFTKSQMNRTAKAVKDFKEFGL